MFVYTADRSSPMKLEMAMTLVDLLIAKTYDSSLKWIASAAGKKTSFGNSDIEICDLDHTLRITNRINGWLVAVIKPVNDCTGQLYTKFQTLATEIDTIKNSQTQDPVRFIDVLVGQLQNCPVNSIKTNAK